jgi:hypothetical protein
MRSSVCDAASPYRDDLFRTYASTRIFALCMFFFTPEGEKEHTEIEKCHYVGRPVVPWPAGNRRALGDG